MIHTKTMGRPRKTEQVSKDYILAKIEKSMAKSSWQDLTLASVAQKVGIKSPSLYHYFQGLEGLKKELALRALKDFSQILEQALASAPGDKKLKAFFEAYREFSKKHPLQFECAQFGVSSKDTELMQNSYKIVQLAIEATGLQKLESKTRIHQIRILRCLLNGFIQLETLGGFQLEEDIDDTFQVLIKTANKILTL